MIRTFDLLRRVAAYFRAHPLPGLLWLAILVAVGTAVDALTDGDVRVTIFISLTATFAQFVVVSAVLRRQGLHNAWLKPGRAASFVGLGIVTGLGILAGLALLILPGLYLYARWIIATPLVVGEGATMGEAMSLSWRRTRSASVPIAAALTLIHLPVVMGVVVIAYFYPAYGPARPAVALAANMLFFVPAIAAWYLAVAVHALLDDPGKGRSADA